MSVTLRRKTLWERETNCLQILKQEQQSRKRVLVSSWRISDQSLCLLDQQLTQEPDAPEKEKMIIIIKIIINEKKKKKNNNDKMTSRINAARLKMALLQPLKTRQLGVVS